MKVVDSTIDHATQSVLDAHDARLKRIEDALGIKDETVTDDVEEDTEEE